MGRVHIFEWEDLEWFPRDWRDYGTDYLQFIATKFDMYKAVLPVIKRGIEESGSCEWVDCASGGGGGLLKIAEHLKSELPDLKITMTDYFPNIKAFERTKAQGGEVFRYETGSVNAMDVPAHLQGKFRTMFSAFHHFRPEQAQKILQNAVDTKTPIAIFEAVGRNPMSIFAMFFSILNVLFLTPFIRPFRWQVLPFIYLLPLIPLYVMWDGFVSCLRVYSDKELMAMIAKLDKSDSFEWEVGQKKVGPMPIFYLLGVPKK